MKIVGYISAWVIFNLLTSFLWVFMGASPTTGFLLGMVFGAVSQVYLFVRYNS